MGINAETSLLATCFNLARMITVWGIEPDRKAYSSSSAGDSVSLQASTSMLQQLEEKLNQR